MTKLTRLLEEAKQFQQLSLFCLGIDTCFRGGDLVRLKVSDVIDQNGSPKSELRIIQQKTGEPVKAALTPYTKSAFNCYIADAGLGPADYLFTSRLNNGSKPITTNYLRRLVKQWAEKLDLNPANYSSHSLRRSKPAYLYSCGVRPEQLRYLLGHECLKSTQKYLGIDREEALGLARKYDCFGER